MKKHVAKPADHAASTAGIVLDAGALLALEKRHLKLLTDLELAFELGLPIRIPAGALAQVWRGGPRSAPLARVLKQPCTVVGVDERSAKEIGEFLAIVDLPKREKPDIVDAHVALVTRATRSLVWTSDPADMTRYGIEAEFVRSL